MDDARFLFGVRNDEVTRANSLDPSHVEWDAHLKWLTSVLKNPARVLLIAADEATKQLCGQVRFDILNDGEAEISISVAPQARGRGYGRHMISAGLDYFRKEHNTPRIIALIKPSNEASKKIFEKNSFVFKELRNARGDVASEVWVLDLSPG